MFGKLGIGILNALSHLPLSVHYFFSDVLLYPLVRYVFDRLVIANITGA